MQDIQRIVDFLRLNGWKHEDTDEYMHFYKDDSVGVDIGSDEIVFIDDSGDYAHIPLDFYAIVGFVYVNRLGRPAIPE